MEKFFTWIYISLFICSGVMAYAYVYDVEPFTAEKWYSLERDVYNHSDRAMCADFPTFNEWLAEQDNKERRLNEYLADLRHKLAEDVADCFDWTRPDPTQPMSAEQWRAAYGD